MKSQMSRKSQVREKSLR